MAEMREELKTVFHSFRGRKAALFKAFTTDVESFFEQCDPQKEDLCLFGYPNETWEVKEPVENVPAERPEPLLGINVFRDQMPRDDWLSRIAAFSDCWLISVTFFHGVTLGLVKSERMKLFEMINEYPTLVEILEQDAEKAEDQDDAPNKRTRHPDKTTSKSRLSRMSTAKDEFVGGEEEKKDDQQEEESFCGACGRMYVKDEFWIYCDVCGKWYHGECVNVTPSQAEQIDLYKCPGCRRPEKLKNHV